MDAASTITLSGDRRLCAALRRKREEANCRAGASSMDLELHQPDARRDASSKNGLSSRGCRRVARIEASTPAYQVVAFGVLPDFFN
jgi:hypothetical protein